MNKSFIIHKDSLNILDELSDEQAGKLFKAIKSYQFNEDSNLDMLTKIAFIPFKNQFERDFLRYENVCERNKQNGKKGGRPMKSIEAEETQINPKNPVGLLETQINPTEPKKPDSKNKSDSKNKNKNDNKNIYIPNFLEFQEYALTKKPNVNKDLLKKKYEGWINNEWHDGNNEKIDNWKSKLNNTLPYIDEYKQIKKINDYEL